MKKKLTLNKQNATISERMNEIYILWDIDVKEARDIIKKMYYSEFNKLKSISEQRLVLHNLVCSEMDCIKMNIEHNTNSVKLWSKTLIDFLNNEPQYVELHLEEYTKAMNNYLDNHKDDLKDEELVSAYEYCYKIYEKYEYKDDGDINTLKNYLEKMIYKFNLNLIMGNFNMVLEVIKDVLIHNNNSECSRILNSFIKDVQDTNSELYSQALLLLMQYEKQNKIS